MKPKPKRVSVARQRSFWKDYDTGKRQGTKGWKPWFYNQPGGKKKQPVVVSPASLGVVRTFDNRAALKAHIRAVKAVNRIGRATRFESFDFQPTQLLSVDRTKNRVAERVYRTANASQIMHHAEPELKTSSLYAERFFRKMRQRGISKQEVRSAIINAHYEIWKKVRQKARFDFGDENLMVLDYNPKTKKPLIAIIDHTHSG